NTSGGMGAGAAMGSGMGASPTAAVLAAMVEGGGQSMAPGMGQASGMQSGTGASGGAEPAFVPLGQLARIQTVMGPPMIKSEMGQLTGWVYVDIEGSDVGGYVETAKAAVSSTVKLPPGYNLKWTGQYEFLERVRERLSFILPLTLGLVFVILYLNFRGVAQTLIVMTAVPFAAVGAIWLLYLLQFNTSIAVWVGMIALLGVAAETASVMVVYLDQAWQQGQATVGFANVDALISAATEAGAKRVRPLLMTVMTNILGLLPILIDQGVGADVAKRIAAPMWGGLVSLTLLTLLVVPAVYVLWRSFGIRKHSATLAAR
ncbi:MAG TPA: efflux RND transporter permease subunit, partial [Polyangiaceae bacterium]|nr:efflux RND transporter permease subunit [Polyangiaceae bacterium]